MATFPGYYVGTTLDTIGNNMSADRATAARAQMAQAEQHRLQYQALQQALMQQAAQQQQAMQFGQDLQFRRDAQQQEAAYRNSLLGLRQQDAAQENTYRYAALENALKQIEAQAKLQDPRVAAARIIQDETTKRDLAIATENAEAENAAALAKASQYNALLDTIKKEAEEVAKKHDPWGWTTAEDKTRAGAEHERARFNEVLAMLPGDRRPGDIGFNPAANRFEPVLRRIPGAQQQANPLAPQPQTTTTSTQRDVPIKVITSDGRTWDALSSQWPAIKQRDPGARLVGGPSPINTPSAPNRRTAILNYIQSQPRPQSQSYPDIEPRLGY